MIRAEKANGSRCDGRTELQALLDFVQPGDVTRDGPSVIDGVVDTSFGGLYDAD